MQDMTGREIAIGARVLVCGYDGRGREDQFTGTVVGIEEDYMLTLERDGSGRKVDVWVDEYTTVVM